MQAPAPPLSLSRGGGGVVGGAAAAEISPAPHARDRKIVRELLYRSVYIEESKREILFEVFARVVSNLTSF